MLIIKSTKIRPAQKQDLPTVTDISCGKQVLKEHDLDNSLSNKLKKVLSRGVKAMKV